MTERDTPPSNSPEEEKLHQDSPAKAEPSSASLRIDFDAISAKEEKLSELVPEIGTKWALHDLECVDPGLQLPGVDQ